MTALLDRPVAETAARRNLGRLRPVLWTLPPVFVVLVVAVYPLVRVCLESAKLRGGGLGLLGIPGAMLSLGGVVALTALEFLVAFLQAFVFAVLTCVYLNDVVNLGHHH